MKKNSFINRFILASALLLLNATVYAAGTVSALWTFTPLTDTTVTVSASGSASVRYTVTNQSTKPHQLVIENINGVKQIGLCNVTARNTAGASCTLVLQITGSAMSNPSIHGGPSLCQMKADGKPNKNLCSQPSLANSLNITLQTAIVPTVTSISPSSGSVDGGTAVTITGTNFSGATGVAFGGTSAIFTVNSNTQITAVSPAGTGTVNVTVTTPGGTSATSAADEFTYRIIPTVTGVSPPSGPTAGGTAVTITGTYFTGATTVMFGSTAVTSFTIVSDTEITTTSPPASAGIVDVTVTSPGGTSPTSDDDLFTYLNAPIVLNVSPSSGPLTGGTAVMITGVNFNGTTAVNFGSTPATSFTVISNTQLSATSPAGTGTVDIRVTTPGGTSAISSADEFSYVLRPIVTAINPTAGPTTGGTSVTITGANFTGATKVEFGIGVNATSFTVNSSTQITATSPAGTAGAIVNVRVTSPSGTSIDLVPFTYHAPPTVASITPTTGPTTGGTTVTITGTNFVHGSTTVLFGSTVVPSANYTVDSFTHITVSSSPAGNAGMVHITVVTPGGTSPTSPADQFTYASAPIVLGVSPSGGPTTSGVTVLITGANFTGATAVTFGGTTAVFTVLSNTQITATSPTPGSGTVDIEVTTAGGTSAVSSADKFTYYALPTVSGLSPSAGPTAGGTVVTITGTNFTGATAISFGPGISATSFTVNSSTQITATSPERAIAGTVNVTVTTLGGTSTDTATFTYYNQPTVTAISPETGSTAGGTPVTITGTNFVTGSSVVRFGATAVIPSSVTTGTIIVTSPPGDAEIVDITVTTPGGTSPTSEADQFTYIDPPVVTGVSPNAGPAAGSTSVTLSGANFTEATTVWFDSTPVVPPNFTVVSDSEITVTSPAGTAGVTVDITVTTSYGTSITNPEDNFTYYAIPTATTINPDAGPTAGGTAITITGTNFTGATAVAFGGIGATSFTVNSSTQITATSPEGASAGAVNVTVTTPGGIATAAEQFNYYDPPTVTAITSPLTKAGPTAGGTTVVLSGTNFVNGSTVVRFGTTAVAPTSVSSGSLTVTSPPGDAEIVDITVTTPGGTSPTSEADQFTYIDPPVVSGVSPNAGPAAGNTSVTLSGANFTGATTVSFGSTPVVPPNFTVVSDSEITVTSPPGTAGVTVDITVTTPYGTSTGNLEDTFTYYDIPTATTINPDAGPTAGGTAITITGTNFTGATAVPFGGVDATSFTVNSSTKITATSPEGASAGAVNVTVTTPGGIATAAEQFTYYDPPTVTNIITPAGTKTGSTAGGTTVTITGTNFTGATKVSFGSTATTTFTIDNINQITVTSPPGDAEIVDITVTTPGGTSPTSPADQFTYIDPPVVTGVSPNAGPIAGNTAITISGTNFTGATLVSFVGSGTNTVIPTFVSDSEITVTSPAGTGTVDIQVTTPYGTSIFTPADNFTYYDVPVVTGISPNTGSIAGGTPVTITGSNFTGTTEVLFGSTPATDLSVTENEISLISPTGIAGAVLVRVITPGGDSSPTPFFFTYSFAATPTNVNATGGNALANVSWTAPYNKDDSAIISYTVTSSPAGGHCISTGTTMARCTNLINGTAYTFTVAATTKMYGTGPASAPSNWVTPGSTKYTIGGIISGYTSGNLVLNNNGSTCTALSNNAAVFTCKDSLRSGASYNVQVTTQPAGLSCSASNNFGHVNTSNVNTINITCATSTVTIGGNISGLTAMGLALQNNGSPCYAPSNSDSTFICANPIVSGSGYNVQISTQPTGLICTANDNIGNNVLSNVNTVQITCSPGTGYTIGGSIYGLTENNLMIENNGGSALTLPADATAFTFATPVAKGSTYKISVPMQPSSETCIVRDGSGSVSENVTNIEVYCGPYASYAALENGSVYHSIDKGVTWIPTITQPGTGTSVHSIFSTKKGNVSTLYAATDTKVQISSDGGVTWSGSSPDGSIVNGIYVSNGGIIYAATSSNRVYISANGTSWTNLPSLGLGKGGVYSVFLDESTGYVYAGSANGSVYYLNGSTWTAVNSTTPDDSAVTNVFVANSTLYAGTANEFVYSTTNLPTGSGSWTANGGRSHSLFVNADASQIYSGTYLGWIHSLTTGNTLGFVTESPINSLYVLR